MHRAVLFSTDKTEDQFLLRPIGRRYFNKPHQSWSYVFDKPSIFIETSPRVTSLIAFIAAKYRKYLIKKSILTLVNPKPGVTIQQSAEGSATGPGAGGKEKERVSVLNVIDQLRDTSLKYHDATSLWWSQVIRMAFYWLTGNDRKAIAEVVQLPGALRNNSLAIALMLTSCLKKYATLKGDLVVHSSDRHRKFQLLLDRASYELRQSLEATAAGATSAVDDCYQQLMDAFHLLAADWLLSTRVELWQWAHRRSQRQPAIERNQFVSSFRQDLATLRYLTQSVPSAQTKLYYYEGAYRLISGTNPLEAQHYFNRALRRRHNSAGGGLICSPGNLATGGGGESVQSTDSLSDEHDCAHSLLLSGRYLPDQCFTCAGERQGTLSQADQIMSRFRRCNTLVI